MSSGFWAGAVPPWAWVVGGCLGILLVMLGAWYGYGRGWKHAEEEERWAREQAKARRTHPVYRQPPEIAHEKPLSIDWADCCVCGHPTFRPYFNYKDQPFCGPCADGRKQVDSDGMDLQHA